MGNRIYAKLLAWFFIVMALLTVLSRTADSLTIPRVIAEEGKPATLAHRATAEGKIEALDQEYVRGETGLFVEKIHVGEGQKVEAGELLCSLDMEALRDRVQKAESEISALELDSERARLETGGSAAQKNALEEARQALKRAEWDRDFNLQLNDGKELLADKRAVEDARAALQAAENQLEDSARRADIDLQAAGLEIEEKQRSLEKLKKLYAAQGNICAPNRGTVGKLWAKEGKELTEDLICTLIPEGAEYIFRADLSAEDVKYMAVGDSASILLSGKSVPLKGAQIRSIQNSGSTAQVTAALPAGIQAVGGQSASLTFEKVTDSFDVTVPLGALRGGNGEYYVLRVKTANTILGDQQKAERVDVTLLEKDGKRAALANPLEGFIISESNKPVEEGDRVRRVSQ